MALKRVPGMKGNCKVLKSDLKDSSWALQDTMLMMQEKCWTTVLFQAYTLGTGIGNFIQVYIFIVKEVRIYKLGVLIVSIWRNTSWYMFHHLPQNSWKTKHWSIEVFKKNNNKTKQPTTSPKPETAHFHIEWLNDPITVWLCWSFFACFFLLIAAKTSRIRSSTVSKRKGGRRS